MITVACLCAAMIFSSTGVFAGTGDEDASAAAGSDSTVQASTQNDEQASTESETTADGFVSENGKVYYCSGGEKQFVGSAGAHEVDGARYYFYEDGSVAVMSEGIAKTDDGTVCVFGAQTTVDSVTVSPLADQTGMVTFDSEKYYVSSGVMLTDVIKKINGGSYYFGRDGRLVCSAWVRHGGKVYRASKTGKFIKGRRIHVGSHYYYMSSSSGRRVAGKVYYDKTKHGRYYARKSGTILTHKAWVKYSGNRYRASTHGRIICGRFFGVNGKGYYSSSSGRVLRRTFRHSGITFHPNRKTGALSRKMYKIGKANGTYVVIDISRQKLTYYKHGKKKLVSAVVTGNGGGHTPIGIFHVNAKLRNIMLRPASGGAWHVNYWMCFKGSSYGMHDAYWRSSFGGRIYLTNGSHGCVNMPYSKAKALYHKVRVGTLVIVQR
jgi:glucan-binding YG repeat protein